MTREEASFILANIDRRVCDDELNDALDMAIKALEQEPILDKIRAEIEEKAERYCLSRENIYMMGHVEWSDRLIKESDVLEIIEKYRQEG